MKSARFHYFRRSRKWTSDVWPGGRPADSDCPVLRQARRLGAEIVVTGQAALFFANHARNVTLVIRGDSLEKSMSHYLIEQLRGKSNIAYRLNSEIIAIRGDTHLMAVDIIDRNSKETRLEDCGGLFVFIGADAETQWLPPEIARDSRGFIPTGDDVLKSGRWSHNRDPYLLETSVPGIFACGDVRLSPVKRVASAVGEGSMAIAFVYQYLQNEGRSQRSSI